MDLRGKPDRFPDMEGQRVQYVITERVSWWRRVWHLLLRRKPRWEVDDGTIRDGVLTREPEEN